MPSAVNLTSESHDQPLLELPPSVLIPRRASDDVSRRFGRDRGRFNFQQRTVVAAAPQMSEPAASGETGDGQVRSHLILVICYIAFAFLCQMLLLFPALTGFRLPLRMAPFLISLALIATPPRKQVAGHRLHPAISAAIGVLVIVLFSMLNDQTDSLIAGIAVVIFYASILAPIVWIGRLQLSRRGFVSIVLLLWVLNTLSCAVGILQVAYPGSFRPATSQAFLLQHEGNEDALNITLANGKEMARPYGLTDQPGGVAAQGLVAFIFGLGLLSTTRRPYMTFVYAAGMGAGLFIIDLCQVRVALVTIVIAVIGYIFLLSWRQQYRLLTRVVVSLGIIVVASTAAALIVGGTEVMERLLTLVADDPSNVYYSNRGFFLDATFRYYLPLYPVGAGLGRYGMMAMYFATDKGMGMRSLWAEIQWTAWVFDGGIAMLVAYPLAVLLALWITLKISFDKNVGVLNVWGTIFAAYNISAIAITFSYCLFLSQSGLEFWLLNALIYSAYQVQRRHLKAEVPVGFEAAPAVWRPGFPTPASQTPTDTPSFVPTPFGSRRRALTGRSMPSIAPANPLPYPLPNGESST